MIPVIITSNTWSGLYCLKLLSYSVIIWYDLSFLCSFFRQAELRHFGNLTMVTLLAELAFKLRSGRWKTHEIGTQTSRALPRANTSICRSERGSFRGLPLWPSALRHEKLVGSLPGRRLLLFLVIERIAFCTERLQGPWGAPTSSSYTEE